MAGELGIDVDDVDVAFCGIADHGFVVGAGCGVGLDVDAEGAVEFEFEAEGGMSWFCCLGGRGKGVNGTEPSWKKKKPKKKLHTQ